MKVAIQASDLDHSRIDGTRVYILNLLKYFGKLDQGSQFLIYHKNHFNSELTPPSFPNYKIIQKSFPFFWTQTRFAYELFKDKPDVLWMPMHNLPYFRRKNLKTAVTIHDLAFKYFPECFPRKELWQINFLTKMAVENCDKIITVSQSSKNDILKFYPKVKEKNIKVIYHGFDPAVFQKNYSDIEINNTLKSYNLKPKAYILYVGGIQPRKNLAVLIRAFEKLKKSELSFDNLKLVLAGGKAWLAQETQNLALQSPCSEAIVMPGKLKFDDLGHLYRGAGVYVYPSLYDGFGITLLEAMVAKVPVISADNSSLPEVGGNACLYFKGEDAEDLARKIQLVLTDKNLREDLIAKGIEQIKNFSWEKCAKETLEFLKS